MSKDFNSDMFSAILKANEKSMALLEKQLEATQKQAKRKDIAFCIILGIMALLLGGMVYVYTTNKPQLLVDYDQNATENVLEDSAITYTNKAGEN